jgi:hypothetical protein
LARKAFAAPSVRRGAWFGQRGFIFGSSAGCGGRFGCRLSVSEFGFRVLLGPERDVG